MGDSPVPARSRAFARPLLCAALLLAAAGLWLGCRMPQGILTYPDELLTAERSREMLLLGRDAVHFNFKPSFAKPPLQYWLTTLTLPRFENVSASVRIWPLIYGLLTAAALGWLSWLLDPKRPWLIPLSVAIYVSCPLFSTEAVRALLDTGLVFFTALALGFSQLARRDPRWWLGVAAAAWLGALQKIPFIFLVWLIIVAVRLTDREERAAAVRGGWLFAAVAVALFLSALWPAWQLSHFHMPLAKVFAGDDLNQLLGETQLGGRPYFEVLDGLLASGWAAGILAIAAAIFCAWPRRDGSAPFARELAIVALTVVVLAVLFNFRSVRYVLPVLPAFALLLAAVIHELFERDRSWRAVALVLTLLIVGGGLAQAVVKMHHVGTDFSNEKRAAEILGWMQRQNNAAIIYEEGPKRSLRSVAFYLFHGKMQFPLKRTTEFQPPAVGVCRMEDFEKLKAAHPSAMFQQTVNGVVCWRVSE